MTNRSKFIIACRNGDIKTMRLLTATGHIPCAKSKSSLSVESISFFLRGLYYNEREIVRALKYAAGNGFMNLLPLFPSRLANMGLCFATAKGNILATQHFLRQGADVNYIDDIPLRNAINSNYLPTVALLVENGAKVGNLNSCNSEIELYLKRHRKRSCFSRLFGK